MLSLIAVCVCFGHAKAQINLTCAFGDRRIDSPIFYSCYLNRLLVLENFLEITIGGNHVVDKTNSDVEGLILDNSRTSFIFIEPFLKFPNLRSFWVNNNAELQRLSGFVFASAPNLFSLFIHSGVITTVDKDAFVRLGSLEILSLTSNRIKNLPQKVFHPLRRLRVLNLENNLLTRLHDGMFLQNGANIGSLVFRNNNIREIGPEFINNLVALDSLFLNTNICINSQFSRGNAAQINFNQIRTALATCFENYVESDKTLLIEDQAYTSGRLTSLLLE